MAAAGGKDIVNMSSVNGVLAIPTIASYNVSKGGINQLTRVMALALADKNIRVNAVAPGTIATELSTEAVLTSEGEKNEILSRTPYEKAGRTLRNCRCGGLAGQLCHRRNRDTGRCPHGAELHRAGWSLFAFSQKIQSLRPARFYKPFVLWSALPAQSKP